MVDLWARDVVITDAVWLTCFCCGDRVIFKYLLLLCASLHDTCLQFSVEYGRLRNTLGCLHIYFPTCQLISCIKHQLHAFESHVSCFIALLSCGRDINEIASSER